ncbi:MAG: thiamine phosphate synthase [Bacteroidota bacterium]
MRISKLQYISSTTPEQSHLQSIEAICKAGGKWIQLRLKEEIPAKVLEIAHRAKMICKDYGATFILNDYPEIARVVEADGLHLGKLDMPHVEAREIIGQDMILGGTANTMEDIRKYAKEGVVDYIGLGPFRYTATKQNLSPILGLEGYQKVVEQCKKEQIDLPIIAIGGILLEDISEIMETGVHGIAVSGLLTKAVDKKEMIEAMNQVLS